MKKIMLFTMLLIMSVTSFSQQTKPLPELTKQDYLQKSKNQKTAAWVLVAGGAALIVTGGIVWTNDINKKAETDPFAAFEIYTTTSGYWIVAAGLVAAAGSIPFFIAAARNKRKAMYISLKNETIPQIQNGGFVNRSVPSLSLKINL